VVSSVKIVLEVGMPTPSSEKPEECKQSPEEQVREALEVIDSGEESKVEWILVNKLYKQLKSLKKPNSRARNLIQLIEPVLAKYGYHKVPAGKFNGG
jgi:hypothetical protein